MKELLELLKENKVSLTMSFKYAGKLHITLESDEANLHHGKIQVKHLAPEGEFKEPEKAMVEIVKKLIVQINALK